jgi:hypothetical protein
MKTTLCRWTMGFLVATGMTWVVGAFCVTEVSNRQWDPDVADYVVHGIRRGRAEGWGSIRADDDGILGATRPLGDKHSHVVLWGDSFVESLNVGDEDSVYAQLNALAEEHGAPWRAVAVAQSGRDIVDHLRLLPAYSSRIPNVVAHVVVVTADDLFPRHDPRDVSFADCLREQPAKPAALRLRPVIQKYRLDGFWAMMERCREAGSTFHVRPGPIAAPPATDPARSLSASARREFWQWWLAEFKRRAGQSEVMIVYHSRTPFLDRGKLVYEDPDREVLDEFAAVCKDQGVRVASLADAFCEFTRRTQEPPCGFANTYPFRGHWNRNGHRLAADAIFESLGEGDGSLKTATKSPPSGKDAGRGLK